MSSVDILNFTEDLNPGSIMYSHLYGSLGFLSQIYCDLIIWLICWYATHESYSNSPAFTQRYIAWGREFELSKNVISTSPHHLGSKV